MSQLTFSKGMRENILWLGVQDITVRRDYGRRLYPMLISTEAPSYTMRFRDTTLPQKTDD
jgi:hypothetical protein